MNRPKVIIIGAGSVGCNAALFLDRLGFSVDLLEAGTGILGGAASVSFINHADGFEYYKPHHRATGEYCVEGALTKALLYPAAILDTHVCTATSPIRFLVAEGAVKAGLITPEGFLSNAQHMHRHYLSRRAALAAAARLTAAAEEEVFAQPSGGFMKLLEPHEWADVEDIAAGVYGNGFGINMPHYYAVILAALRRSGVRIQLQTTPQQILRHGSGYLVRGSQGEEWQADQVLLCAAHHIPRLTASIQGAEVIRQFPGTYYLNGMTFLRLPATEDAQTRQLAHKITFTLMEEHGCMLACITPPTAMEDGLAAIYHPSSKGSQIARHTSTAGHGSAPPAEWEGHIQKGLPNDHPNPRHTFEHACRLYPVLRGYAEISHTSCRTVFNVSVPDSADGTDRRVRELSTGNHAITRDGRISAWAGPKWTNAELAALMATDHVLQHQGLDGLQKSTITGCGPTLIDVATLAQTLHFRDLKLRREDALDYTARARLPARMVQAYSPYFESRAVPAPDPFSAPSGTACSW